MFLKRVAVQMDDGHQESSSRSSPVFLYTAETEIPSSQTWFFSDALVELYDGIVSRLGDAVTPDSTAAASQ